MSHVDEGLLHAYLDGAFAPGDGAFAPGDEQGAEIEAHLASCADCRGRLEDARTLKDRAHEVLRHATPIDVRVPPFEALREWKQGGSDRGTPALAVPEERVSTRWLARSPVRLAWAASVVLAVGAGWMANELTRRDVSEDTPVQTATFSGDDARAEGESMAAPARHERAGEAGARVDAARSGGSETRGAEKELARPSDRDVAPAGPGPSLASPGEGATSGRTGAAQLAQVDSPPPPAAVAAAPSQPSNEPVPLARTAEKPTDSDAEREPMPAIADMLRRRAAAQAEAVRITPTPVAPRADMADAAITQTMFRAGDVIRLDMLPPALANGRAFDGHVALVNDYTAAVESGLWSHATAEQAASALGREPARIENLRPVETETAAVNGLVLLRQRYTLEDGASLELIQRPATLAIPRAEATVLRDRAATLPPAGVPLEDLGDSSLAFRGASVVALSRPGLVLLLKGPVPQDSLHGTAARIR